MRMMLGLMRPAGGEIHYSRGGKPVDFETLRPEVAYMPQQQSLYADLSIEEHLDFFRASTASRTTCYQAKKDELLRMTRLTEFVARPAGQLSGGMYKKLGLMCALLRSPRAILLDEPTNGVDPISRREFWDMLYRLSGSKNSDYRDDGLHG